MSTKKTKVVEGVQLMAKTEYSFLPGNQEMLTISSTTKNAQDSAGNTKMRTWSKKVQFRDSISRHQKYTIAVLPLHQCYIKLNVYKYLF